MSIGLKGAGTLGLEKAVLLTPGIAGIAGIAPGPVGTTGCVSYKQISRAWRCCRKETSKGEIAGFQAPEILASWLIWLLIEVAHTWQREGNACRSGTCWLI